MNSLKIFGQYWWLCSGSCAEDRSCSLNDVSKRLAYFGREAVASPRRSRLNCVCASQATEHATLLQFVSLHFNKAFHFPLFPLQGVRIIFAEHHSFCATTELPITALGEVQPPHISDHGAEAGYSWVCQVFSDYSRVRRHLQIVYQFHDTADTFI